MFLWPSLRRLSSSLCLKQVAETGMFVLEHPAGASPWQLVLVNKLLHVDNAERRNFDFCKLGIAINVQGAELPVKKRTSVVTNFTRSAKALLQR